MLDTAKSVLRDLRAAGFEAYIVGGYVRDSLLDAKGAKERESSDIDITSSAHPDDILRLFERVEKTGYSYGTVTIIRNGYRFEHTSFRKDLSYPSDSRAAVISFSDSLKEDAERRDFTINALAMDENGKIYDFFHGLEDLEAGRIRAIGNPSERFREDALRTLRAIRFAGTLGFEIEEETFSALCACKNLASLSKERVKSELDGILSSKHRSEAIRLFLRSGLLQELFPQFQKNNNSARLLQRFSYLKKGSLSVAYAAFFYDLEYAELAPLLQEWKFSKKESGEILRLSLAKQDLPSIDTEELRVWLFVLGKDRLEGALQVLHAEAQVEGTKLSESYPKELSEGLKRIMKEGILSSRADLCIDGNDLLSEGLCKASEGKTIGRILETLLDLCIRDPKKNRKDFLLEAAKNLLPKK